MEKMLHIKLMGWLRLSRTGWLEVMRQLEKQQRGAEEAARVVAGRAASARMAGGHEKQQRGAEEAARVVAGRAASVRMAGRHEKGTKRGLFPT